MNADVNYYALARANAHVSFLTANVTDQHSNNMKRTINIILTILAIPGLLLLLPVLLLGVVLSKDIKATFNKSFRDGRS